MKRTNSKNILKKKKLSKRPEKYFKADNSVAKNKNLKKKLKTDGKTTTKKNIKSVSKKKKLFS